MNSSKKHAFTPSLDGRLEDRVVLNGGGARGGVFVDIAGERLFVPREAILTTRTYNNVLVNIHRATQQLARSQGNQMDYDRAGGQIGRQLARLPYARQEGLIDYVNDSLQFYGTNETQQLYSDIRSTTISYLSFKVLNGEAAIRKSPGHFFSDSDIYGRNGAIYNQGAEV